MLLGLGLSCCFGFFLLHNTCKDYLMGILTVINDFGSCTPFQRVSSSQFIERYIVFTKYCG